MVILEVKQPELGLNHPPSSSAEVKETVELYPHSPLYLHNKLLGEIYIYTFFA